MGREKSFAGVYMMLHKKNGKCILVNLEMFLGGL